MCRFRCFGVPFRAFDYAIIAECFHDVAFEFFIAAMRSDAKDKREIYFGLPDVASDRRYTVAERNFRGPHAIIDSAGATERIHSAVLFGTIRRSCSATSSFTDVFASPKRARKETLGVKKNSPPRNRTTSPKLNGIFGSGLSYRGGH